jgi:hypothetical protein
VNPQRAKGRSEVGEGSKLEYGSIDVGDHIAAGLQEFADLVWRCRLRVAGQAECAGEPLKLLEICSTFLLRDALVQFRFGQERVPSRQHHAQASKGTTVFTLLLEER